MRRMRLVWQLNLTYSLVTILALTLAGVVFFQAAENHVNSLFFESWQAEVERIQAFIRSYPELEPRQHVSIVNALSESRLEVVHAKGQSLLDQAERQPGETSADVGLERPQRTRWFAPRAVLHSLWIERYGQPNGSAEDLAYVISPSTAAREQLIRTIQVQLLQVGLMTVTALMLLGVFVNRKISQPISRLVEGTKALAAGELDYRLPRGSWNEVGILADNFNSMSEQLKAYFTRLMQERANLRELVHDMAHQIKTPLTSISMYNQLLLEEGVGQSEPARGFLLEIGQQVRRLERLSHDLLELSLMEAGTSQFFLKEGDLLNAVSQAVETLRPAMRAKQQVLVCEYGKDPLLFPHDSIRIQDMLENLLENAVKFTPKGGQITVTARSTAAYLEISVQDTGVGIPPAELPHVQKRFYQGKAGRQEANGSCGLGLAIARSVIDAHKGDLRIQSTQGTGTAVSVLFPCVLPDQELDYD